jgi:hypothetical protein
VPIIPTDGESIDEAFWQILEAFDPDLIFRYEPTWQDVEDADREQYSNFVDEWIRENTEDTEEVTEAQRKQHWEQFRSFSFQTTEVSESLVDELRDRLNPFHRDENVVRILKGRDQGTGPHLTEIANFVSPAEMKDIRLLDPSNLPAITQLLTESVTGRISTTFLSQLGARGINPDIQPLTPSNFGTVVSDLMEKSRHDDGTLHSVTNLHCISARRADAQGYEEPVVLVTGSTLGDYCLYKSLASVKPYTFWLPEPALETDPGTDGEEALVDLRGRMARDILSPSSFYRRQRNIGEKLRVISRSFTAEQRREAIQRIENDLWTDESDFSDEAEVSSEIEGLLEYRREVFEAGNVDHRSQMQFDRGVSVESVDTPKPNHFDNILKGSEKLSWITDLEIEDYHLPQHSEFGPDTLDIHWYDSEWVRVSRNGFSYYCPHHTHLGGQTLEQILARPQLNVSPSREIMGTLFGRAGYEIQLSDKGDFQRQAGSRVGGFEKLCKLLQRADFRELLDRYTEVSDSNERDGFPYLRQNRRAYASFEGIEDAVGENTSNLIDDMVELDVLHRGLIFQCQFCRNADWYDLSSLSQSFECSRCGQEQKVQRDHWKHPSEGPEWFFKLDEIIYQFYNQNTHITSLALSYLKENSNSFIHVPEIELHTGQTSGNPADEIDICAVVDGSLVIGEASISADKGKSDVDKYLRIADEVDARTIVFATLAEGWSSDLQRYAAKQGEQSLQTWNFLTCSDLL